MLYKTRHGHNTGNTLRRRPRQYLHYERYNDGEWHVTDKRSPRGAPAVLVGPDGLAAHPGVPYSLKKQRGWEMAEWVAAAMVDGALENDAVELVQGHRAVAMERRERTRRVLRKAAGARAPLQEMIRRRGFINAKSALTTLRAEEEEEDAGQRPRRRGRRRRRQKAEEEEKEWIVGAWFEKRDLTFAFDEATIPDTALVRSASCPWAKYYRHRRAFAALEMEADLHAGLEAADHRFSEEEEEEEEEARPATAHSVLDFLFSSVLRRPSPRRNNARCLDAGAPANRKDRKGTVEGPGDAPAASEAALDLEDRLEMVPLAVRLPAPQLRPSALQARFGPRYREAASAPRAFAVALGEAPLDAVGGPAALLFVPGSSSSGLASCDVTLNAEVEGRTRIFALPPEEARQPFPDVAAFVARCEEVAAAFGVTREGRPSDSPPPLASRAAELLSRPIVVAASEQTAANAEPCDAAEDRPWDDVEIAGSCGICFDLVAASADGGGCALHQCGHVFCSTCWRRHLIASIRQGRSRLLCPATSCPAAADVITALRFVSGPLVRQQLRRQEETRLRLGRSVVWCPRPLCARSIRVDAQKNGASQRTQEIACNCGYSFCGACNEEVHWPASCRAYRVYKAKLRALGDWNRSELDAPRVRMRLSQCPGCGEFIEKVSGCFFVRCACGVGFCWNCGKPASHFDHNCEPRARDNHQTVNFVGEVFSPNSIRSNTYCSSVRSRLFRQTVSNAHLNRKRLRLLLQEEFFRQADRAAMSRVRQEVQSVVRDYKELLRLIEFCYVAALSLHKSLRCERRQLKVLTEQLQGLAALVRAVINWTPLHCTTSRAQLLRTYFEQVRRAVRTLSAFRKVLTDDKALRLQF